ncbi:MAG: hypothetical protein P8Z79_04860 [Sedimentisphaerales bacterium]
MKKVIFIMTCGAWICSCVEASYDEAYWNDGYVIERGIPRPLADHPGNIYLDTEEVWVKVPAEAPEDARSWQALDDKGRRICGREFSESSALPSQIRLGRLPVGWYRVEFLDGKGACLHLTTAAVLKKLVAPIPQDSPVCVDSATAWFAKNRLEDQKRFASFAALAGVNWIRDRLTWRELEPRRGEFTKAVTTYDTSAAIQKRYGLKVLQVFHMTPEWAWDTELDGEHPSGRFARDLRDVYRFCEAMAKRFHGQVLAWEPWNEANVSTFGGHTVDEMCSFQKAAFLGFKAGDPTVTVCWNVYTTTPTPQHTQGLLDNEEWSYYDTYNIHTYDWAHDYERLWVEARKVACGKPIWVTEADRGIKYTGPEPFCDLSREDELRKARYIPQSYASSLHAGSVRHFHFILGHYSEGGTVQFGLLRKDMTPRPAYVALAAVGRLLAGAKCLGRWDIPNQANAHVVAFRAWPDGRERDVLVAWAEKKADWPGRGKTKVPFTLPESWHVEGVFDYLGRQLDEMPAELAGEALFIVLPAGQTNEVKLSSVERSARRVDRVCPIVLQVQMPRSTTMKIAPLPWSQGYEYRIDPGQPYRLHMFAYNFGRESAKGTIRVENKPSGWVLDREQWTLSVDPAQRQPFEATLTIPAGQTSMIRLAGDFGSTGKAALAFRVQGQASEK